MLLVSGCYPIFSAWNYYGCLNFSLQHSAWTCAEASMLQTWCHSGMIWVMILWSMSHRWTATVINFGSVKKIWHQAKYYTKFSGPEPQSACFSQLRTDGPDLSTGWDVEWNSRGGHPSACILFVCCMWLLNGSSFIQKYSCHHLQDMEWWVSHLPLPFLWRSHGSEVTKLSLWHLTHGRYYWFTAVQQCHSCWPNIDSEGRVKVQWCK